MYSLGLPLLLTMTLHLHRGGGWPIVFPPSSSFKTAIKDAFLQQYVVLLQRNHTSMLHQVYHWYTALCSGSTVFPWYCPHVKILTCSSLLIIVCHPPYKTGVNFLCLAVIILVNKYRHQFLWNLKIQHAFSNHPFLYKINLSVMKSLI